MDRSYFQSTILYMNKNKIKSIKTEIKILIALKFTHSTSERCILYDLSKRRKDKLEITCIHSMRVQLKWKVDIV